MISKPDYWHSDRKENDHRRSVIAATQQYALEHGDQNVYYIDGSTLLEGEYSMNCTWDGVHPNDLGFYRMTVKIGKVLGDMLHI